MDIFVCQNRRRGLITTIYDKRLDDKFKNIQGIRYPHTDSCLANMAKYRVVTSQMHRFARRCSLRSDFVYNTRLVIHTQDAPEGVPCTSMLRGTHLTTQLFNSLSQKGGTY